MLNSVGYIIRQAFISIKRNIWLSIASVMTMMISLAILGFALLLLANAANIAQSIESQVQVVAFMEGQTDLADVEQVQREINSLDGVASISLTTPDQALVQMAVTAGQDAAALLEDFGGINPLPYKFTVEATDAQLVKEIAQWVMGISGIYRVDYGQGILERLLEVTRLLRTSGLVIVIIFAFAAFALITLNIRTNVCSRSKEIQIMRLVGASNAFIRGPFFIEGMLIGCIGAILAAIAVGWGYSWLAAYIVAEASFLPIVSDKLYLWQVLGIMVGSGVVIGALASIVSMGRFLKF